MAQLFIIYYITDQTTNTFRPNLCHFWHPFTYPLCSERSRIQLKSKYRYPQIKWSGKNPQMCRENMQTPHKKAPGRIWISYHLAVSYRKTTPDKLEICKYSIVLPGTWHTPSMGYLSSFYWLFGPCTTGRSACFALAAVSQMMRAGLR